MYSIGVIPDFSVEKQVARPSPKVPYKKHMQRCREDDPHLAVDKAGEMIYSFLPGAIGPKKGVSPTAIVIVPVVWLTYLLHTEIFGRQLHHLRKSSERESRWH